MYNVYGTAHAILVLLSYAQKPRLYAHAGVRGIIFGQRLLYFYTLCKWVSDALKGLCLRASSPESSLLVDEISTQISCDDTVKPVLSSHLKNRQNKGL